MNDEDHDTEAGTDPTSQVAPWLERIRNRSLGDVRIHDSAQAGELARRLGARAFTAGRHIYVRPELARPGTPEGDALVAHELWHVAEQTRGVDLPQMPLLRPSPPSLAWQVADWDASSAAGQGRGPGHTPGGVPVQRETPTSGSPASEAGAESVESMAMRNAQGGARKGPAKGAAPDPELVAERVYELIVRELMLDNERAAHGW